MKYEMIFGDQSLFDGAPEEATHATKGGGFYKIENMSAKYVSDGIFNGIDVLSVGGNLIAERRIIKEPKRWTWEDQQAGRLPEVGSYVLCSNGKTVYTIEAVNKNENQLCVRDGDDGDLAITYTQYVTPIETPAEKAQREEDEFFFALKDEWQNPKSPPISSASFEVGVRAAYRKMKGGESEC